jgi:hypothetical protein
MNLAAIFQCYKNPLATFECLQSFRKFYPDSKVILLSDNGYDYTEMAKHFNCTYVHETRHCGLSAKITEGYLQTVERLLKMITQIRSEYFILLEDDVNIIKKYTEEFKGDINGNCINKIRKSVFDRIPFAPAIREDTFYTGHGGSVYKTETMLGVLNNDDQIKWLIANWESVGLGPMVDVDIFLSLLVLINGGTIHHLTQHKDLITNGITDCSSVSVLHQVKKSYGVPLPENLYYLLPQKM